MNSAGVEVRPLKQMTGDEEFCEVFFTDVSVPVDALLGPENEVGGWRWRYWATSGGRSSRG